MLAECYRYTDTYEEIKATLKFPDPLAELNI